MTRREHEASRWFSCAPYLLSITTTCPSSGLQSDSSLASSSVPSSLSRRRPPFLLQLSALRSSTMYRCFVWRPTKRLVSSHPLPAFFFPERLAAFVLVVQLARVDGVVPLDVHMVASDAAKGSRIRCDGPSTSHGTVESESEVLQGCKQNVDISWRSTQAV